MPESCLDMPKLYSIPYLGYSLFLLAKSQLGHAPIQPKVSGTQLCPLAPRSFKNHVLLPSPGFKDSLLPMLPGFWRRYARPFSWFTKPHIWSTQRLQNHKGVTAQPASGMLCWCYQLAFWQVCWHQCFTKPKKQRIMFRPSGHAKFQLRTNNLAKLWLFVNSKTVPMPRVQLSTKLPSSALTKFHLCAVFQISVHALPQIRCMCQSLTKYKCQDPASWPSVHVQLHLCACVKSWPGANINLQPSHIAKLPPDHHV